MAFQYELFNVLRAYFHLPKVQMTDYIPVKRKEVSFNWNFSNGWVWSIFTSYTVGFFMTWYISYLKGKKKARQMNENLKKWKEAQKKSGIKR